MTTSCHKKCINTRYKEGSLSKGEAVCIDRCVAKYLDVHERIGKHLTSMNQADQAAQTTMAQANAPASS